MKIEQSKLIAEFSRLCAVEKYFPIVFNSGHKIDKLNASCEKCGLPFYGDDFRGKTDFLSEGKVVVTCIGRCDCGHYENFIMRFQDEEDDIYVVELMNDGTWNGRVGFIVQSKTSFFGFLGFLLTCFYLCRRNIIIFYREKIIKNKLLSGGKRNA